MSDELWFDRFKIVRTLGEGGAGRVFLAEDTHQGNRRCAWKILSRKCLDDPQQFRLEYDVLKWWVGRHPDIVRVYDYAEFEPLGYNKENIPYYTMEVCKGKLLSLKTRYDCRSCAHRSRCFRIIAMRLARALHAFHACVPVFVHRDLKLDNVMISCDKQGAPVIKLIDPLVAMVRMEQRDVYVGTPEYEAPELLMGELWDERVDLYSLGLVIYEMVTRRSPWRGSEIEELIEGRLNTSPPSLVGLCEDDLAELVMNLLRPDPADRPSSAREVFDLLAAGDSSIELPFEPGADEYVEEEQED